MTDIVKYEAGINTVRRITKQEFAAAGVEDQDTVEWSEDNAWLVPASAFTTHALELVKAQEGFKVIGGDSQQAKALVEKTPSLQKQIEDSPPSPPAGSTTTTAPKPK